MRSPRLAKYQPKRRVTVLVWLQTCSWVREKLILRMGDQPHGYLNHRILFCFSDFNECAFDLRIIFPEYVVQGITDAFGEVIPICAAMNLPQESDAALQRP